MATLFHNCSLLGFVPLKALKGLSTQRVWHGASRREDRIKSVRRSRAIHYKINDDVAAFTRYFTRPYRQLSDTRYYRRLESDPTTRHSEQVAGLVQEMFEMNHIDKNALKYLTPTEPPDDPLLPSPKNPQS